MKLATPAGIEPATNSLEACCSLAGMPEMLSGAIAGSA